MKLKNSVMLSFVLILLIGCSNQVPNDKLQAAINLVNEGKTSEAIIKLDNLIKEYPEFAPAYLHRATYKATISSNHIEIMSDLDKAISLDPKFKEAFYYRGQIKDIYNKIYESGTNDFDRAIELDTNYTDAYVGRGTSKNIQKLYASALADFDKSINLNYKNADVYCDRGLSLLGLKMVREAITSLNYSIQLDSMYHLAFYFRCLAHMELNDTTKACEDCSIAARLGSTDAKLFQEERCKGN